VSNYPDDWDTYHSTCGVCGLRYHASEGGCGCDEHEECEAPGGCRDGEGPGRDLHPADLLTEIAGRRLCDVHARCCGCDATAGLEPSPLDPDTLECVDCRAIPSERCSACGTVYSSEVVQDGVCLLCVRAGRRA